MWGARKPLLATVVFTAVLYRLAAPEPKQLDAATNVVDKLYSNCSEKVKKKLIDSDLEKELHRSMEFKTAWESNTKCSERMPEGKTKQITALSAFVNGGQHFQKIFNDEVETKGVNVSTYENDFNFKSLHFLLMSSMEMQPHNCKTAYISSEDYDYEANEGSEVRLGRFMIAEEYTESEKTWQDGAVILNITSCFFVDLGNNTCTSKSRNALLLSPAEVFSVVGKTKKSGDMEYSFIILKHLSVNSSLSCSLSRSPASVSTSQWIVFVLAVLSLFFLNC